MFEITYNIPFTGLYKYKIRMKELVYTNVSSIYNLEKIKKQNIDTIKIIHLILFFYRVRN